MTTRTRTVSNILAQIDPVSDILLKPPGLYINTCVASARSDLATHFISPSSTPIAYISSSCHTASRCANPCKYSRTECSSLISPSTVATTRSIKSEKCGRLPGLSSFHTVSYNEKQYAVFTIQHKKNEIQFLIDERNLSKVVARAWHLSSGKYIATNVCADGGNGDVKEVYLHRFLFDNIGPDEDFNGDAERTYIIHLNNNCMDNRMENLRVVNTEEYLYSKQKRKRTVCLPADSQVTVDDIPKYIYFTKADKEHGDRFVIEIPQLGIVHKLSCSKKVPLKDKLEEAKKTLDDIYRQNPEIDPRKEDAQRTALTNSFNEIIALFHSSLE